MNDKQRAEFEKWAVTNGYNAMQKEDGSYLMTSTTLSWKAWQAAIASVVVELPNHDEYFLTSSLDSAVRIALDAAGVKYE